MEIIAKYRVTKQFGADSIEQNHCLHLFHIKGVIPSRETVNGTPKHHKAPKLHISLFLENVVKYMFWSFGEGHFMHTGAIKSSNSMTLGHEKT